MSSDGGVWLLVDVHVCRAGITFVSVHDCFWTHACDVEIMNKVSSCWGVREATLLVVVCWLSVLRTRVSMRRVSQASGVYMKPRLWRWFADSQR